MSEDSHWNSSNSIYGDNPTKINEHKDPLGLNVYTYIPDINAIQQSGNLYAYGLNNPIMYQDPTGYLVWPGEIHNAVSSYILWTQLFSNGTLLTPNKFVSYGGLSFGFADLYDENTGEVWEIKPDKPGYYKSGPIQLQKYIDNIDGAKPGNSLGDGSFYYFSTGKLLPLPQVYKVDFISGNDGMIYYKYKEIFGEEAGLALLLLAAAVYTGTYNGVGVTIPGLA